MKKISMTNRISFNASLSCFFHSGRGCILLMMCVCTFSMSTLCREAGAARVRRAGSELMDSIEFNEGNTYSEASRRHLRRREQYLDFIDRFQEQDDSITKNDEHRKSNTNRDNNALFSSFLGSCSPLKKLPHNAENVRDLKPQDIKAVIALGDSITAAFAADNEIKEYRGASWSIGGDPLQLTMPNLLQSVLPQGSAPLAGASRGKHLPEICIGKHTCPPMQRREDDYLNAAQSGALTYNLIGQAKHIVSKLPSINNLDYHNDWKIATILIGANDLCEVCQKSDDELEKIPQEYDANLREALEILRAGVPKLLVNIVAIGNISSVDLWARNDEHLHREKEIHKI